MQSSVARIVYIVLCSLVSGQALARQPLSLRDDAGRLVSLDAPAVRIVTLAPSLAELVFAAGAGDKLMGVSAYSDFPAAAQRLPQVADATGVSWESLLALKPDLVLAWKDGSRPADISRLATLGVNVFVVEISRLADVSRALTSIGALSGRPGPAEIAAARFRRQSDKLRETNAEKTVVRTFVEISAKPLTTVSGDHVVSEIIRLCGGSNVFDNAAGLVVEPSREELLARAPDVILYGKSPRENRSANEISYHGLPAVHDRRIYGITADYLFRPGPRLLRAAEEVCAALDHGRENLMVSPAH